MDQQGRGEIVGPARQQRLEHADRVGDAVEHGVGHRQRQLHVGAIGRVRCGELELGERGLVLAAHPAGAAGQHHELDQVAGAGTGGERRGERARAVVLAQRHLGEVLVQRQRLARGRHAELERSARAGHVAAGEAHARHQAVAVGGIGRAGQHHGGAGVGVHQRALGQRVVAAGELGLQVERRHGIPSLVVIS